MLATKSSFQFPAKSPHIVEMRFQSQEFMQRDLRSYKAVGITCRRALRL
jgi:hypothetical protein